MVNTQKEIVNNLIFQSMVFDLKTEALTAVPNFSADKFQPLIDILHTWEEPIRPKLLEKLNPLYSNFHAEPGSVLFTHVNHMEKLNLQIQNSEKMILIVSAAPTSGKDTITEMLLNSPVGSLINRPLTGTTREERKNDPNDKKTIRYYSTDEFQTFIKNDELIEYVPQGHDFYGTRKRDMQEALEQPGKKIVLWRGEPIGGRRMKDWASQQNIPVVWMFLLPSRSFSNLFDKINMREGAREWRLGKAIWELTIAPEVADVILTNPYDAKHGPIKAVKALENFLSTQQTPITS